MRRTDYLKYINYDFTQSDEVFHINTDTAVLGMFIEDLHGKTVLDIGTGTGVLPRNMYKYGAEWTGTDISPEQIEQA